MKSKFLVYSDPHWSQYSSIIRRRGWKFSVRLENLIKSFNWVESFAVQNECNGVICAGDFFDKSQLNAEEITALQSVYFSDLDHYFVVGNHESNINTLEYSTTMIFQKNKSHVFSSISKLEINDKVDMYFIPYLISDKIPKLSDVIENEDKKNIIIAHQDLAGLRYGKFVSQSGFDINDIVNNCTLFLDGHLHNSMTINDKIVLLGNLTGKNFDEDATKYDHSAYLLTIEDDGMITLEQVQNPYAFNFYSLRIENKNDLNQFSKLKNNAVVSIVCDSTVSNDVDNILASSKNIVESRKIVSYSSYNFNDVEDTEFKVYDHFKQFIEFAQQKFEPSPALIDELTRLGG